MEDTGKGSLNLPKLKTLELHFSQTIYLDFMLPMKGSLEHLRLYKEWGPVFQPNSDQFDDLYLNEQFLKFDAVQQESKMWKVFPNMKSIFLSGVKGDCLDLTRK